MKPLRNFQKQLERMRKKVPEQSYAQGEIDHYLNTIKVLLEIEESNNENTKTTRKKRNQIHAS
jgi:hypothetical protein